MSGPAPTPSYSPIAVREALELALQRDELSLVFQPQVSLHDGKIVGAEALLRWDALQLGSVSPEIFVPVAEECGLITKLGNWVLQRACAAAAGWRDAGLPAVRTNINVSPYQLLAGDFAGAVRQATATVGLPPEFLGIEITESSVLLGVDDIAMALHPLKALGVEIALDDFGSGNANLAQIKGLPLDMIKIDRSFVSDLSLGDGSASITRAAIQLAHALHLPVGISGVETDQQLQALLEQECDRMQGWYFSAALSAEDFGKLLASGRTLDKDMTHTHRRERVLLLVDDEENIVSAVKRVFRREGYKILTAHSGTEGLEVLAREPVDVILSDQRMPGMTGVDFLRRVRDLYPETVRMTLSGYTDLDSIISAVNEGAIYRFLTKPWDDSLLREHVAQAFAHRELVANNRRLAREVSVANAELARANRRLAALVHSEHERGDSFLAAAGQAHDMVDLVPMALFGFDDEGMLVYVNHYARKHLPTWAASIGASPSTEMCDALAIAQNSDTSPASFAIDGTPYWVWQASFATADQGHNVLLMLQQAGHPPVEDARRYVHD